jgi:hypothetical protein
VALPLGKSRRSEACVSGARDLQRSGEGRFLCRRTSRGTRRRHHGFRVMLSHPRPPRVSFIVPPWPVRTSDCLRLRPLFDAHANLRRWDRPQLGSPFLQPASGRHAAASYVGRCVRSVERFDVNLLRCGGPERVGGCSRSPFIACAVSPTIGTWLITQVTTCQATAACPIRAIIQSFPVRTRNSARMSVTPSLVTRPTNHGKKSCQDTKGYDRMLWIAG